ncbi:MAG: aldose 1-epimerase family protein [Reichenbachiella sp.]|uniref:aldose 1-epimerase family protein n=1 Tax=Reichenbachiella sp. TaxID=2184521 RepID=UPI0029669209|nr:aldose 1-epimerase family protein [Reichenbachiella sp.]MDW3209063.1 aldose 1-epimerase family protein [Reichenbachiella sp.]
MKYSIENDLFKVEVDECGAELCSILSKKSGHEYIWQADEKVWKGSAPVLFPVIGALKSGSYIFNEKSYELPKHGFVRNSNKVRLINRTRSRLSFILSSDEETLDMYPFKFDLKVSFFLFESRLQIFHEVANTGDDHMYFSLGGHPAFNYPWKEGENKDDYYLEFERKENNSIFVISENGLLTKDELPMMEETNKLPLKKGLFDNDALIFTELNSSEVSIKSKSSKDKISVNFDDFPFLGVWSKPNADFLCIEPWDGLPDFEDSDQELTKKPGIIKLGPGSIHYASYTIQIFEA